ncbi:MAG: SET domain-containing protein [Gemmatimonadaceae bacterium]
MPRKRPLYRIRQSGIQGRGVFAARRIRPGQRIIEYGGERITAAEGDRRYDDKKMKRHHTFLFSLDKNTVIDGNRHGNDARYINHSCDPNCEAVTVGKKIFIYARRNIQPGIELAYDYKYEWSNDKRDIELYKCECGSARCRGTIMQPKSRRRRKRGRRKR